MIDKVGSAAALFTTLPSASGHGPARVRTRVWGPRAARFGRILFALLALCAASSVGAETAPPPPIDERPAPAGLPDGHSPWPVRAEYVAPTGRYPHGVLGRVESWGGLVVDLQLCPACGPERVRVRIELPETRVYEDLAPRLWDITGDGRPEVVVIESDVDRGARLAVWVALETEEGPGLSLLATTSFIGTRFRWLAPAGAGDFTGDGVAEIAYVETPHLGRILRLVSLREDRLVEIARLPGVTNHAIGDERIHGGVRFCDGRNEVIVQSGDRSQIVAVRYVEGELVPRVLGPDSGNGAMDRALICE